MTKAEIKIKIDELNEKMSRRYDEIIKLENEISKLEAEFEYAPEHEDPNQLNLFS